VQSILSNKPLSCDDIQAAGDARRELKRIRELMHNFEQSDNSRESSTSDPDIVWKAGRNAIIAEENFNDYVKKNVVKGQDIRDLIYDAIKTNVMFSVLTEEELEELIDIFEPCVFNLGDEIIRQGDIGDEFYVVERGTCIGTFMQMPGHIEISSAFGEQALIYGSSRAVTITATMDGCKLWRIRRAWYRGVVGQHRQRLHMEKLSFLPMVKIENKLFRDIFEKDQLHTMAHLLTRQYYTKGDTILRQGEVGDFLSIVRSGEIGIYLREIASPGPIYTRGKGYIFGEEALLKDDVRDRTVVAAR
jgi:cAMP-dependent protein kinase regulator